MLSFEKLRRSADVVMDVSFFLSSSDCIVNTLIRISTCSSINNIRVVLIFRVNQSFFSVAHEKLNNIYTSHSHTQRQIIRFSCTFRDGVLCVCVFCCCLFLHETVITCLHLYMMHAFQKYSFEFRWHTKKQHLSM